MELGVGGIGGPPDSLPSTHCLNTARCARVQYSHCGGVASEG